MLDYQHMLDEGLYDNEPHYIRATLYERIFKEVPVAGYEGQDLSIDIDALFTWIKNNGFEKFHGKLKVDGSDGEIRHQNFYVNKKKKIMITMRRSVQDSSNKEPDIRSSDDVLGYLDRKRGKNKLPWVSYYATSEKEILDFKKYIESIAKTEESKDRLFMLKSTDYGSLELDSFPVTCSGMPLELNYGKEFQKVHDNIIDRLKTQTSGLYVFHGPPGTGKTSYIKYLTTTVTDRKFIFVPNTLVSELFSPKLVDKLYSFKNSILVLEDAEICVFKRDGNNNALVSGILNITDGLLKDLLNIGIMVTFNSTDISEVDTALLRKGRLKVMHKFDLLSEENAKKLAKKLKKKKIPTTSLSLADIYNIDEDTGLEEEGLATKNFGFSP